MSDLHSYDIDSNCWKQLKTGGFEGRGNDCNFQELTFNWIMVTPFRCPIYDECGTQSAKDFGPAMKTGPSGRFQNAAPQPMCEPGSL